MKSLGTLLLLAALSGCATTPEPEVVWDSHVHLNDVAMQLALMDEFRVARAVVFWGGGSDNAAILAAAAKHPDRFIPFASISPERRANRLRWERDDPAIVAELEQLLATGRFRGIGEINIVHDATARFAATDFGLDSAVMRGIMALARQHRIPVLIHCEMARVADFERMLATHRDVAVIWAHGGYGSAAELRRMLATHSNLHVDLAARTWRRHPRSAAYLVMREGVLLPEWAALIEAMPERFMVGTDASHRSEASERMKFASLREFLSQLSPQARREVGWRTLGRLLGVAQGLTSETSR